MSVNRGSGEESEEPTYIDDIREEVREDQPPSATLVFLALEDEGWMTLEQISEETLLSKRTARNALEDIDDAGYLDSGSYVLDPRKKFYGLCADDFPEYGEIIDSEQ